MPHIGERDNNDQIWKEFPTNLMKTILVRNFLTNTTVIITKRSASPFWSYSQNTRGDPAIKMYFNNISANCAPFGVIWVSFGREFYFGPDGSGMIMSGIVCGLLF